MTVSRNERAQRPEEERTFVIGGETFVYRTSVAAGGLQAVVAMVGGEFILRDERAEAGSRRGIEAPISTLTEDEALAISTRRSSRSSSRRRRSGRPSASGQPTPRTRSTSTTSRR
jgi:hypothetical protein